MYCTANRPSRLTARTFVIICAVATFCLTISMPTFAAVPAPAKQIQWLTNFQGATVIAQKQNKLMLVYFSGSDWDEWTQKLEKEVLHTPMVVDWVEKNVVPVQVDMPKEKRLNSAIKQQNKDLVQRFNVAKVPSFLFIDTSGEVICRCGYDALKLRDNEPKDQPKAAVEALDTMLKSRPPEEQLSPYKTLKEGVAAARKHGIPLLMVFSHQPSALMARDRDIVLNNQKFIRFVNRNMAITVLNWPEDYDKSPDAMYTKGFATQWKFGPAPVEMVVWDPGGLGALKEQITSLNPMQIGALVKHLDSLLPRIDYNGGWIEDYKLARAISAQQKKELMIAFVSTDGSEWSQKMDQETFQTPEFKKYAKENMVLLRVDFPKASWASSAAAAAAAANPNGGSADTSSTGAAGSAAAAGVTAPAARPLPGTRPANPTTQKSPIEVKETMVTGKHGEQPFALKEQNRMLADMFAIRGYPTVIFLNPMGQKYGEAKYMKGGVSVFLKELDTLRKKDKNRRTLISEEEAAK